MQAGSNPLLFYLLDEVVDSAIQGAGPVCGQIDQIAVVIVDFRAPGGQVRMHGTVSAAQRGVKGPAKRARDYLVGENMTYRSRMEGSDFSQGHAGLAKDCVILPEQIEKQPPRRRHGQQLTVIQARGCCHWS